MLFSSIAIVISMLFFAMLVLIIKQENIEQHKTLTLNRHKTKTDSQSKIFSNKEVIFFLIATGFLLLALNLIPHEIKKLKLFVNIGSINFEELAKSENIQSLEKKYQKFLRQYKQDKENYKTQLEKLEKIKFDNPKLLEKEISKLQEKIAQTEKTEQELHKIYLQKIEDLKKEQKQYVSQKIIEAERNSLDSSRLIISKIDHYLSQSATQRFVLEGSSGKLQVIPIVLAYPKSYEKLKNCTEIISRYFEREYLSRAVKQYPPVFEKSFLDKISKPVAKIEIVETLSDPLKKREMKSKERGGWKIEYEVNKVTRVGRVITSKYSTGFLVDILGETYFLTALHNFKDRYHLLIAKMLFNNTDEVVDIAGISDTKFILVPDDRKDPKAMVLLSTKPENRMYKSNDLDYLMFKLIDIDENESKVNADTSMYAKYGNLKLSQKSAKIGDNLIIIHHPFGASKCISYVDSVVFNTKIFEIELENKKFFELVNVKAIRGIFEKKSIFISDNISIAKQDKTWIITDNNLKDRNSDIKIKYSVIEDKDLLHVYFGDVVNHVYYTADTMRGSSGSPVLNEKGEVVALHIATVKAHLPSNKEKTLNLGVKIQNIYKDILEQKK